METAHRETPLSAVPFVMTDVLALDASAGLNSYVSHTADPGFHMYGDVC